MLLEQTSSLCLLGESPFSPSFPNWKDLEGEEMIVAVESLCSLDQDDPEAPSLSDFSDCGSFVDSLKEGSNLFDCFENMKVCSIMASCSSWCCCRVFPKGEVFSLPENGSCSLQVCRDDSFETFSGCLTMVAEDERLEEMMGDPPREIFSVMLPLLDGSWSLMDGSSLMEVKFVDSLANDCVGEVGLEVELSCLE